MTTPSEALAVALNGLNRAIDEMWNDEARRVALPERHVKEITRWQAIAQAALRSAPVPSAETQVDSIMRRATEAQAERTRTWPSPATSAAAETAPHPAGGDGIVERLLKINPWRDTDWPERIRDAAAEIERLRAQVATARSEAIEEAAKVVAGRGPASQDMTSTMICEALDDAAAAIRAIKENDR